MLRRRIFSIGLCAVMFALCLIVLTPVSSFAQRRLRSRIVIYQPRPYVVYQRRPAYTYRTYTYGYPQSYYSSYYSNGYGYPQPYYATPYYSYRYSQPNYSNGYAYSSTSPGYYYQSYRPRHRARLRIVLP